MRKTFVIAIMSIFLGQLAAQKESNEYDPKLATELGADAYGMKQYVLVILKTGTNTTASKQTVDSLFRGHLENIGRLANEGKLVLAGPLGKNEKSYRGIFILNVKTIDEAKELIETDPAVKAHLLDGELYPWYGSAALPSYLETHKRIEKKKPSED